ncbi:MAG: pro-sigmaK processing inhibitor BofA family protein [Ruminococcus sp.]|nr:pro-sigmaK processing inhibitor BofA family protein [Ruminococcus sp.]
MISLFLILLAVFVAFAFVHFAAKKKKPFRRAFLSMLIGIGTMCAVNLMTGLTGVFVPVTRLTVLVSAIGGVPGVALMVLLSAF